MGKYSIKELEQLSGIKAHTIRIWEKRHNLIQPKRTSTNIRYYSDEDLKKIINISVLNNNGIKISKIVNLTAEAINKQVVELAHTKNTADVYIDQMVVTMVDLDEEQFDRLILSLNIKFGLERTITEVIYPFLDKIGVLWQTGNISPAQEHFISNLIRQKLIVAIDGLPIAPKTADSAVLFLPENELHELGLLFQHYLTKKSGLRTYYLGQSVPHDDLKKIIAQHKPQFLIVSITSYASSATLQDYIHRLASDFASIKIFISGAAVRQSSLKTPPNIIFFEQTQELVKLITV